MNPILNKMGANANEQKKLLMECVSMLEKYVNRFPAEKGCASFSGEDMKLWKEVYFRNLFRRIFCWTVNFSVARRLVIVVLVQTVILPVMNFSSLFIVPTRRFMNWKRLHK